MAVGQPDDQDGKTVESGEMGTDSSHEQSLRIASRNGLPVVTAPAEVDFTNAAALALASTVHSTIIVDMCLNRSHTGAARASAAVADPPGPPVLAVLI